MIQNRSTVVTILLCLAIGLVAFFVYANTLGADFAFDDRVFIVGNKTVHGFNNLTDLVDIFNNPSSSYRPIRNLSVALDHAIWGMEPFGFHLTNCLLHAIASILVFLVSARLLHHQGYGWLAAAFFALHPIHTESVANVSGRKDILATIFYLGGWITFLRYRANKVGSLISVPLIWICLTLSVFSKEMGITLPATLFLWDMAFPAKSAANGTPPGGLRRGWLALRSRPVFYSSFATVVVVGLVFFLVLRNISSQPYWGGTPWTNALTACRIQIQYLSQLAFPLTLIGDYSFNTFPVSTDPLHLEGLVSMGLLAVLAAILYRLFRSAPLIAFLGGFYFVTMLPVAQIKPHHEMMAERFLYLPSIALAILSAVIVRRFARTKVGLRGAITVSLIVCSCYGVRTVTRNFDWKDDLTFWRQTVEVAPNCVRARRNYAYNLYTQGSKTQALQQMDVCLTLQPDSPESLYNMGWMLENTGSRYEAIQHYLRVPFDCDLGASALLNVGRLHAMQGESREAEEVFKKLIELDEECGKAYYNLGTLKKREGKLRQADKLFRQAKEAKRPFPQKG